MNEKVLLVSAGIKLVLMRYGRVKATRWKKNKMKRWAPFGSYLWRLLLVLRTFIYICPFNSHCVEIQTKRMQIMKMCLAPNPRRGDGGKQFTSFGTLIQLWYIGPHNHFLSSAIFKTIFSLILSSNINYTFVEFSWKCFVGVASDAQAKQVHFSTKTSERA